ncbi:MAG: dynamin family protein [Bacteroidaceae bacterium]|nr:dynamin family protein [Bacteroidaceae bacterium]
MANCNDLHFLKKLIEEGEKLGLDFSSLEKKINEYINNKEIGTIKIVLLGSFSDGKTTAIAGLLGKLESNMKIDEDESSDELSVYHIDTLGKQYEIVDTPGLFGTKEKEVDGVNVKFSEITERYISEAHIVIYVCNSVNTLKDSHKEIIKKVLRDYNKLDSTIFVINKMDDVADTNDEDEYSEVSEIKRNTFIDRLRQVIGLTPEEEKRLNIACIAANPKAKGLNVWFEKPAEYKKRSHIGQLEDCVANVTKNSDIAVLKNGTDMAVVKDLAQAIAVSVSNKVTQLKNALSEINSSVADMESDLSILKAAIIQSKGVMTDRFIEKKNMLLKTIDNLGSLQDMGSFLETEIGIEGDKLDFHILIRQTKQIISECAETNNASINTKITEFERVFDGQNSIINGAVKSGIEGMKKVNGGMVLKARDIFFKGHKFKPWGAIKVAKSIGAAAAVLGIAFDGWNLYKKYKNAQKLDKCKIQMKDALSNIFKQIFKKFDQDDVYYKNFAPSYLELVKAVNSRKEEVKIMNENVTNLNTYRLRFEVWYGGDIEDAIFEEIK